MSMLDIAKRLEKAKPSKEAAAMRENSSKKASTTSSIRKPCKCCNSVKEHTAKANATFASEFKLYEGLFTSTREAQQLTEVRSVADIQAEIARLQQELADAKVAEKKASYAVMPDEVYIWDMYLDPSEKGTWTSAELYQGKWDGVVFETEDDAINGAYTLLNELEDENELDGYDPVDYDIDAFSVPIADVHEETLEFSGLAHLI